MLHVIVWRIREKEYRGVYLIVVISIISYILICLLGFFGLNQTLMSHLWTSGPFYFCLIMLYSHFYVGFLKSVSIRIIEELVKQPNKSITLEEIKEIYPAKEMVKTRLNLLEEKKWLTKKEEKYFCLSKATRTVLINMYLHKIFLLNKTG